MKNRKNKDNYGNLVSLLLLGGITGGIIGFASGLGFNKLSFIKLEINNIISLTSFAVRLIYVILFFTAIFLFRDAKKLYQAYQKDDSSEELYVSINKKHDYSLIFNSLSSILCFFCIVLSANHLADFKFATVLLFLFDIAMTFVVIFLQGRLMKFYSDVRQIDIPLFPTVKELSNNILQQDEAELLNEYKSSFTIVMSLSGYVLPTIEIMLFIYSVLTRSIPFLGLIIVTIIHLYIILMQFKSVRDYYK
ncbi:DUF3169 family protein [Streptococcus pacificus]|uniref:DUF3169 family protein n=1 Tax=Streptococcus pacificus TaxID=2740577 RepID=A0ABS0ZIZ4_9STRE|nr:DUF3169 family protein [Streptococcus pacificus]MBJ8325959.1 DUF3169 family protein [Streptococcus pacificus]